MNYAKLPSIQEAKSEAKQLRLENPLIKNHAASLEALAKKYKYKNWNILRAAIEKEKYLMRPKSTEWYEQHTRIVLDDPPATLFSFGLRDFVLYNARLRGHRRKDKVLGLNIFFSGDMLRSVLYSAHDIPDENELDLGGTIDEILGFLPRFLFESTKTPAPYEEMKKQEKFDRIKEVTIRPFRESLFEGIIRSDLEEELPGDESDIFAMAETIDVMHTLDDEFYPLFSKSDKDIPYELYFQEKTAFIPEGSFSIFSDKDIEFAVSELKRRLGNTQKGVFETYGRVVFLNPEARERSNFFTLCVRDLKEAS